MIRINGTVAVEELAPDLNAAVEPVALLSLSFAIALESVLYKRRNNIVMP